MSDTVEASPAQTACCNARTHLKTKSPPFAWDNKVLGTAARHDHLSSTLPPFAWDTTTHSADEDTAAFVSPVSSRDREALGPAARHDHLGMTAPPFSWEEAPCATGAP